MKRILVTTLLLLCMALVGCNPNTLEITTPDDLSGINLELDGVSAEDVSIEEGGSINVSFDNSEIEVQNSNTETPTQNNTTNNTIGDITDTTVQDDTVSNQETQVQVSDSYRAFKGLIQTQFTENADVSIIQLNQEEVDLSFFTHIDTDYATIVNVYVVKHFREGTFLIISYDAMSWDFVTEIYDVDGDAPVLCQKLDNVKIESYDANKDTFAAEVTINAVGTYWADMEYALDDNGNLVNMYGVYTIDSSEYPDRHKLTVVKELPVRLSGSYGTLQPGIQILITGSNNLNEMYFTVVGTDEEGVITYEGSTGEGGIKINGIYDYEYFDILPYAG